MSANPYLLLARIDGANYLRDRLAVFWTIFYPIIMLAVLMVIFGNANSIESARYFISGLAALNVISVILFGFTGQLIEMRASGALRMFYVLPMKKSSFIGGYILSRVTLTLGFSLIFIAAGYIALNVPMQLNMSFFFKLILCLLIGTAMSVAFGLMLALLIDRTTTGSAVINIINIPIMFLSDFFIPMSLMPKFVQDGAHFSPFYHFVTSLRSILNEGATALELSRPFAYMLTFTIVNLIICGIAWRRAGTLR